MGTRNLTAVYKDGEYCVAQYGQWDGYPEGQGITCLEFLRDKMNEHDFRTALERVHFADDAMLEKIRKKFVSENGFISIENSDKMKETYPELSRDTGAEILSLIQNDEVLFLKNDIRFAADSLFCEWAWVIDLDKRTFEAYEGFNKEPLTPADRFYFLHEFEDRPYHGIKLVHTWSFDALPSNEEFIAAFKEEDNDE